MDKIDLIIECMEQILNDELPSPENMMKAYRYACELRELKPVAFCALTPNGMMGYFDGKPMIMVGKVGNDCHTTPLYALEVTK